MGLDRFQKGCVLVRGRGSPRNGAANVTTPSAAATRAGQKNSDPVPGGALPVKRRTIVPAPNAKGATNSQPEGVALLHRASSLRRHRADTVMS